jgi:putative N6-adenine-specific DNA methylase
MQSLWKKAIVKSLSWESDYLYEDDDAPKIEILILLIDNTLRVLLNTSWKALHMRWYRLEAGEAPIKESLAASLVLLAGWKFKQNFYDPFCWAWTIPIEAYMIAKNIAPWLQRKFDFEDFDLIDSKITKLQRELAKKQEYEWDYNIFASDVDNELIEIAKQNAINAWLEWKIHFEVKSFEDIIDHEQLSWTLVSNPPYWERLNTDDLVWLYNKIDKIFRINPNLSWGVISSFMDFDNLINKKNYKKRKLYNWWEKCYFWKKINI